MEKQKKNTGEEAKSAAALVSCTSCLVKSEAAALLPHLTSRTINQSITHQQPTALPNHGHRCADTPSRGPRPRRPRRRGMASGGDGGAGGPRGAPAAGQGAGFRRLDGRGAAAHPREPGAGVRGVRDQRARAPGARRHGDPLQAPLRRHRGGRRRRHRRPALRRAAGGYGRATDAGPSLPPFSSSDASALACYLGSFAS